MQNSRPGTRSRLDLPGTLAVSSGLFALVFGFSHAQTSSWTNQVTIGLLVTGVLLLVIFVALEARGNNPLLPLRIIADRNRGASFLSIGISGAAVFAVFLFLTYYLQQTRGLSPITTGLAFLPLSATIMIAAVLGLTKLQARLGPRSLVITGMTLGALGMLYLTQITVGSSYAEDVLPALLLMGVGLGLVISTSMSNATLGVEESEAGVGSATVNASQQVGASLGIALLSTIATSATTHYLTAHRSSGAVAQAAVHGYTVGFSWAAGIFALGALVSATLFTRRVRTPPTASADNVRIRYARQADDVALGRLAGLDSAAIPTAPLLVAEVNGELRAALSLDGSEAIADPLPRAVAQPMAWTEMGGGALLPGGGIGSLAVGAWLLHQAGMPRRQVLLRSSGLFVLTSAASVIAMLAVGVLLITGAVSGPHHLLRAGAPSLAGAVVVAAVLTAPAASRHAGAAARRGWLQDLVDGIGAALRVASRPSWRLLGAAGYLGFDIAVLGTTCAAVGQPLPIAALVLGYIIGYLANLLPVPGGVAILDGGLTGALVAYGAHPVRAIPAVLVYHAIAFWIPSLGGVFAYGLLRRRLIR